MFREIVQTLKSAWKALVATDLLFKVIAFVALTPLVSLLFRGFVSISGREVLADVDIAQFLLHPIGWMAAIAVGGAAICVFALETAALTTIGLASVHGSGIGVVAALRFVAHKAGGVFRIAVRAAAWSLLAATPFLAAGGGIYLWLLTEHDINYYLAEKPPVFWMTAGTIGALLIVMAGLLAGLVVNWSIAVPLHLFENVSPRRCLSESRRRLSGRRVQVAKWIFAWAMGSLLVSAIASGLVLQMGRLIGGSASTSLWRLTIAIGVLLLVGSLVNLLVNLLSTVCLALLQAHVYDRFGRSEGFVVPEGAGDRILPRLRLTRARTAAALVVGVLASGLVGVLAVNTIPVDDDVEITAHRGASGGAPENTLASVLLAIEEGADWVEIDVQESSDGVVVVAHDSDLKKVAGVDTKIWEATAKELGAVDIGSYFGTEFQDERVPTLADVLAACQGKVGVNIELKYYGHDEDLEQRVVEQVERYGMGSDVVVMSLDPVGVRKLKQLRPDWTVGRLTAVAAGDLTRTEADFLAVSTRIATRSFIRAAHDRGKEVHVWTVNDAAAMSAMASRGADNLITDYPGRARRVLEERAGMTVAERVLIEFGYLLGFQAGEADPNAD